MKKLLLTLLIFLNCNPIKVFEYATGYTEVDVYVCLGPTFHAIVKVPNKYVCRDTMDKYFKIDPENGMYQQRFSKLKIVNDRDNITYDVSGYSEKAKVGFEKVEEIYIPFSKIENLSEENILVYFRL